MKSISLILSGICFYVLPLIASAQTSTARISSLKNLLNEPAPVASDLVAKMHRLKKRRQQPSRYIAKDAQMKYGTF